MYNQEKVKSQIHEELQNKNKKPEKVENLLKNAQNEKGIEFEQTELEEFKP